MKQLRDGGGAQMRWDYSIVLKKAGNPRIEIEQIEFGGRAGGTGDISGGMGTAPFARRLAPGGELRIDQSDSWGCPECVPAHLPRVFAEVMTTP